MHIISVGLLPMLLRSMENSNWKYVVFYFPKYSSGYFSTSLRISVYFIHSLHICIAMVAVSLTIMWTLEIKQGIRMF